MNRPVRPLLCLALACASPATIAQAQTAGPAPAVAEDELEDGSVAEIVVTANKRTERLQDVPMSVSALGSEQLQDQRIVSALDLNAVSPLLRVSSGDAAANPKIFIRGTGISDFNPSASSGVGIYVDGVYVGSPLAQLSAFYDLARIEVLRGPQGTLYGRNTTGGAINVITNRPSSRSEGLLGVEYGSFNTVQADAALTGPLGADLSYRLSGQYLRSDGYSRNRIDGSRIGAQNRYALRGQLLYSPSDSFELLAQGSFFRSRGDAVVIKHRALFPSDEAYAGADGLCLPQHYNDGLCTDALGYADTSTDPYSVETNVDREDAVDVVSASLQATIGLPFADLVLISAYQDAWRDDFENTDASPLPMIEARYHSVQREFSQEVRLQSRGKGPVRWVAGVYYMRDYLRDDSSYDILRVLRPLFVSPENPSGASLEDSVALFGWPYVQKTDSYALFGQLDWDLAPRLTVTAGLRWSADDKAMDYRSQAEDGTVVLVALRDSRRFSDWSGRLGLSYELSDTARLYATYNRGYKSGGFFGGFATTAEELQPYDNETLDAYEAGFKTEFANRRMRASLSGFYYKYRNQQVFSLEERNEVTVQVLTNAGKSHAYGGEAELAGSPLPGLDINLSAGWLEAKIDEFVTLGTDYSGNRPQHAPRWTLAGGFAYEAGLSGGSALRLSANANWRSKVYFDNSMRDRLSEGGKATVDAQLSWRSADQHLELGVFGKNLFDTVSLAGVAPLESFGVDLLNYAPPRRLGLFLRAGF